MGCKSREVSIAAISTVATARNLPLSVTCLVSLVGATAIGLPFAAGTSPAKALISGYDEVLLAIPSLLVFPIAVTGFWLILRRDLPLSVQWASRVLAACAIAATAFFFVMMVAHWGEWWFSNPNTEWLTFWLPLLLATGWIALMVLWRPGRQAIDAEKALALMEAAYLPNAVLCLFWFAYWREIGWYLCLAVSAGFAVHVIATSRRAWEARSKPGSVVV